MGEACQTTATAVHEHLIFSQTVEGLLRAVGPLSPEVRAHFKTLGLDVDRPLRPAYPLDAFVQMLDFAGGLVAPGQPPLEQTRELGRRFMDAYQNTLIGRAMVAGMRVIGPWRTLDRLSHKFRTGNNFSETHLSRLGPTEAKLWCNRVSRPGWYLGVIGRGLELAGAQDVTVRLIDQDVAGGTFHVQWR
ncbi:MAG: DUF2378 family protein [Myxococcaceae bacterium]|nr:DUF2378 family protein [Myxococcaceae bacterium]